MAFVENLDLRLGLLYVGVIRSRDTVFKFHRVLVTSKDFILFDLNGR